MVQRVVIVLWIVVGHWISADDQLQSVSSLSDERHRQAAVEVSRPYMVYLKQDDDMLTVLLRGFKLNDVLIGQL